MKLVCVTAILAAEPLATFECQEITGRDWPRTVVTYPLEFKAGQARPGTVRLTDRQGQEVRCQLSRLTTHPDGSTVRIDTIHKTLRLVLLDGQKTGYGPLQADTGTGPFDLTFHHDKVVGVSEGPGRFIHLTMPEGIVQLPALTIHGISYAPGTYGHLAIVPVLDGGCEFTLESLPQPPVFRSWQQW